MEKHVIAAASSYKEKYFLDPNYASLPKGILESLQASIVSLADKTRGIAILSVVEQGIQIEIERTFEDIDFDEIHSKQMADEFMQEKENFLAQILTFHMLFVDEGGKAKQAAILHAAEAAKNQVSNENKKS